MKFPLVPHSHRLGGKFASDDGSGANVNEGGSFTLPLIHLSYEIHYAGYHGNIAGSQN